MGSFKFVGSGALNLDIFYEVEDLASLGVRAGEEISLKREEFFDFLKKVKEVGRKVFVGGGGSSANTTFALALLGVETAFLGAVGEDEAGDFVLSEMKSSGVDVSQVLRGGTTGLALIVLDEKKDRFIAVSPGTCEGLLEGANFRLRGRIWLHISSLVTEEGFEFHRRLFDESVSVKSVDPGEIYAKRREARCLLESADYVFLTEKEFSAVGIALSEYFKRGVKAVFLKMGRRGAGAYSRRLSVRASLRPVSEVVDNTGAGDYFNAGAIFSLIRGRPLSGALKTGLLLAAKSLSEYGRKALVLDPELKKTLY